jgi:hypothetical protein
MEAGQERDAQQPNAKRDSWARNVGAPRKRLVKLGARSPPDLAAFLCAHQATALAVESSVSELTLTNSATAISRGTPIRIAARPAADKCCARSSRSLVYPVSLLNWLLIRCGGLPAMPRPMAVHRSR